MKQFISQLKTDGWKDVSIYYLQQHGFTNYDINVAFNDKLLEYKHSKDIREQYPDCACFLLIN